MKPSYDKTRGSKSDRDNRPRRSDNDKDDRPRRSSGDKDERPRFNKDDRPRRDTPSSSDKAASMRETRRNSRVAEKPKREVDAKSMSTSLRKKRRQWNSKNAAEIPTKQDEHQAFLDASASEASTGRARLTMSASKPAKAEDAQDELAQKLEDTQNERT